MEEDRAGNDPAGTPFLIRRTDGAPFGMVGLREFWRSKKGETIHSCTIIVTEVDGLVRGLHNRMPVILAPERYTAWLEPENNDAEGLRAMLRPIEPTAWESPTPIPSSSVASLAATCARSIP